MHNPTLVLPSKTHGIGLPDVSAGLVATGGQSLLIRTVIRNSHRLACRQQQLQRGRETKRQPADGRNGRQTPGGLWLDRLKGEFGGKGRLPDKTYQYTVRTNYCTYNLRVDANNHIFEITETNET